MGRPPRITESGVVYHLLNRRVMRLRICEDTDGVRAHLATSEHGFCFFQARLKAGVGLFDSTDTVQHSAVRGVAEDLGHFARAVPVSAPSQVRGRRPLK